MKIEQINKRVLMELASTSFFEKTIDDYINQSNGSDYISVCVNDYYYSYPDFGKQWKNSTPKLSAGCFHRVEPICFFCRKGFEKGNNAGVMTINVMSVRNSLKTGRLIICCDSHLRSFTKFKPLKVERFGQIQMDFN